MDVYKNYTHSKQEIENEKIEWIVTPLLEEYVKNFIKLFDLIYVPPNSKMQSKFPLLIHGDTGIGKSMFVEIFKNKYQKKSNIPDSKIKRVNVAAFNKNLIEYELFGHAKGSYTGAEKERDGFIKEIDNCLLILEEIGELPKFVQAKLLTFIEDGYYYPVGSNEIAHASIQIIATINKPKEAFREDFFNRFFRFYIHALYERRWDILYYFISMHEEIAKSLTIGEVFYILTY